MTSDDLDLTQEFDLNEAPREDPDLTQALAGAGVTGSIDLSADETVILDGTMEGSGAFRIGKHSVVTEEDIVDLAFMPKTLESNVREPDVLDEGELGAKPSRGKRAFVVVLLLVLACALAGGIAWLIYQHQREQVLLEPHPVQLVIDAPGYDIADSKIPFRIEGVDATNARVDAVGFVGPDGTGIELACGTYQLTVAASPLLDDAQFYRIPELPVEVVVPENLEEGASVEIDFPVFEFMYADLVDVSDEQLNAAYDYAIESGFEQWRADKYWGELTAKRDAALAQERASEEKQELIKNATSALEGTAKEKGMNGVSSLLVDLDGDDAPELLLVGNSSSSWGAMGFVFGYDGLSHQVLELCSAAGGANHNPSMWYAPAKHEVVFQTTGPNTEMFTFYSVQAESATLEYTYAHTWGLDPDVAENKGSTESYALDSTPISQQSFQDMINGLSKYYRLASPSS